MKYLRTFLWPQKNLNIFIFPHRKGYQGGCQRQGDLEVVTHCAGTITLVGYTIFAEDTPDILLRGIRHAVIQGIRFVCVVTETFDHGFAINCNEENSKKISVDKSFFWL